MKVKSKAVSILEYLLMLSVIAYSSVWALLTSALSNTFSRVVIILLSVLLVLRFKDISYNAVKRVTVLLFLFALFLFFTRYNFVRAILYLIIPVSLFTLYFSTLSKDKEENRLFLKFSDIMVILSALSLILYLFGTILNILPFASEVRVWWGEEERVFKTFYHLIYEAQDITFFGHNFMRNCGIFPEAPAFAAYLSVSFAVELFLREKKCPIRMAILALTAVTSFSAKALILFALALTLKLLFFKTEKTYVKILKVLVVIFAFVFAFFVIKDKMANGHSFYIRLDDLKAAMSAFCENPLFGTGYYNDTSIITYFEYPYRANDGLSMGLAVLMAQGGIYLLSLYLVSTVKAIINSPCKLAMSGFAIIFYGMLFITNVPFGMITLCIISYFESVGDKTISDTASEVFLKWRKKA